VAKAKTPTKRTSKAAKAAKPDSGATAPSGRRRPPRRDRAAAGERIAKMAREIVRIVHDRKDPFVDIPSRTLSNVQFNEQKGIIELLDGKQRRFFFSL
jgi:hypothetical protein